MMPIFKAETIFGEGTHTDQWGIVRKLGEGQFAEVYEVKDLFNPNGPRYAVKFEKKREKSMMRVEAKVEGCAYFDHKENRRQILQQLGPCCDVRDPIFAAALTSIGWPGQILTKLQDCPGICRMLGMGCHREHFYIQMELLGLNLAELRRERSSGFGMDGRASVELMRTIGFSLLKPLRCIHEAGYIHRDIKPANFAAPKGETDCAKVQFVMIDFGLARRFVDEEGTHLPERHDASFRGSKTYASVHAHYNQDLSRRDDLWSWFYILVELVDGTLPWRKEKDNTHEVDRENVLRVKEACLTDPSQLTSSVSLPDELAAISTYLSGLEFQSDPDYEHLEKCLSGQMPSAPAFLSALTEMNFATPNSEANISNTETPRNSNPPKTNGPDRRDSQRGSAHRLHNDNDRDRETPSNRRDRAPMEVDRERERDRDHDRERDRDRDRHGRDFDRDREREADEHQQRERLPVRDRDALRNERHDKESNNRERDDRGRELQPPPPKRGRFHHNDDDVSVASGGSLRDRDREGGDREPGPGREEPRRGKGLSATHETPGSERSGAVRDGCEHGCHPARVAEVRELARLVREGSCPSGDRARRAAEAVAALEPGESLGAIGIVIDAIMNSADGPSHAELAARWLEALSCFSGDASARMWDHYLDRDAGYGAGDAGGH